MGEEEKKETKVYVKGKLVPVKELEKVYPEISLANKPSNVRVIEVLTKAEKPLNRKDIADRTGLSGGYTRDVLKKLAKKGYVLEFQLGGRTLHFLLTEKGLKLSEEIISKNK
jgi:DNA-binding MarR family transcriptional regulator